MARKGNDIGAPEAARLQYQLRVVLEDGAAERARGGGEDPALGPLHDILARHGATLVCQYDAFAGYCAEAERDGIDGYPLYAWTRATIEDPAKRAKYVRSFSLHVAGEEVYDGDKADALERELRPLVGGPVVKTLARHDTNPANNPQMPERYRS
ncbi:MAG: hypothetical protein OXI64_07605 [Defluviicoccus sp.]|nr:hypothetical protein [Defluviicoccus sp.]